MWSLRAAVQHRATRSPCYHFWFLRALTARFPPRSRSRPHRPEAQDAALSRPKRGFDSRWGHQLGYNVTAENRGKFHPAFKANPTSSALDTGCGQNRSREEFSHPCRAWAMSPLKRDRQSLRFRRIRLGPAGPRRQTSDGLPRRLDRGALASTRPQQSPSAGYRRAPPSALLDVRADLWAAVVVGRAGVEEGSAPAMRPSANVQTAASEATPGEPREKVFRVSVTMRSPSAVRIAFILGALGGESSMGRVPSLVRHDPRVGRRNAHPFVPGPRRLIALPPLIPLSRAVPGNHPTIQVSEEHLMHRRRRP